MDRPTLYLECSDCHMRYESLEQLNTHKARFCKNSDYGDYSKLQRLMSHATKEKQAAPLDMSKALSSSTDYLVSFKPPTSSGPVNLNSLAADISKRQHDFRTAAAKLASNEQALKDELEKVANAANRDGTELLKLMAEIEDKKEAEVRALKEKELVSRALKDLDKRNLNALEIQKKSQMKELAEERSNLQKKEEDLFEELKRMQARLMDDERMIKEEKDRISRTVVTVKEPDLELAEKRIEELSNIRGKEVLAVKEERVKLELEKQRIENELRMLQRGEFRKNNSGILAGNSIMGPLAAANLEDRRDLPDEVVRQNAKWKDEFDRLEALKKTHLDYVNNEPGYEVKPAEDSRPMFVESMLGMVKNYDSSLAPAEKARVYEYIKEDLAEKDPFNPRIPIKPTNSAVVDKKQPENVAYNTARFKLSTEPYAANAIKSKNEIFSNEAFEKYEKEARDRYKAENNLPGSSGAAYRGTERGNFKTNSFSPQISSKENPQQAYFPGPQGPMPSPGYPYYYPPYDPYQSAPTNPEAEKLKLEIKSLKKLIRTSQTEAADPHLLQQALSDPLNQHLSGALPEEKLLVGMIDRERDELKLLSDLPKDSELYHAKLAHFKEMASIRGRMEAALQELTMQRMKRNIAREQAEIDKRMEEELWREDQKRLQVLAKLQPPETNKEYSPAKGLFLAWDMLTGVPQKFRRSQIVYGVYERGEVRLEPRLVIPAPTEEDPTNALAQRSVFKDMHDLKRLPPLPQIIAIIEVQAMDALGKVSVLGWTVLDLFTTKKSVQEGWLKLPIYRPPTIQTINIADLPQQVPVPNSFLYLRAFAADNAARFSTSGNLAQYRIPQAHVRDLPFGVPVSSMSGMKPASNIGRSLPATPGQAYQPHVTTPGKNTPAQNLRAPSKPPSAGVQSYHSAGGQNRGIAVRLETLTGFKSRSQLKFRLSVLRANEPCVDDNGGFCKWISEPIASNYPDNSLDDSRSVHSHNFEGVSNEVMIHKQTQFIKDFYRLQDGDNWSEELILLIEVLERNSRKLSQVDELSGELTEFFPVAWTAYVLTERKQRQFNFSTVELSLFKPPVPQALTQVESAEQTSGSLKVTVQDVSHSVANSLVRRRPATSQEPFLENMNPPSTDNKPFNKGDGIDVYIDGARYLPDNTSCTKIIVKSFNSRIEALGAAVGGLAELSSLALSPSFAFRTEFRTPVFDPTSTLVISIITIDTSNHEVRLLGYAAINLFLQQHRRTQPQDPNEQGFVLNAGAFQLPIYCQEPFRREPFAISAFTSLEIIPCATLLVRIREAPKSQQGVKILSIKDVPKDEWYVRGVIVPPPRYEQRAYNTSYCMPSPIERELYKERAQRPSPTVLEATTSEMRFFNMSPPSTEEEALQWIDDKLKIDPRTPVIDMKYFAKYSPRLGFKVSIDAVHHAPKDKLLIVVFSLNPPGGFYSQSIINQDVQIADRVDWNSALETPRFIDGFHMFKNVRFDPGLHVVIDVRAVNMQNRSLESLAWTVLPVFFEDGYVKTGAFQIPCFRGPVPAGLLPDIASNKPWEYVLGASKTAGGPKLFEGLSVLLRLVDTQRETHFETPMDLNRIDYGCIPKEVMGKVVYNAAAAQKNADGLSLKKLLPQGISPVNYSKSIHEVAVAALDLQHLGE